MYRYMKNIHILLCTISHTYFMAENDEHLSTIRIKEFNPLTSNKHPRRRKIAMRNAIQEVLNEKKLKMPDIRKRCYGKPLGVKAKFYLLKSEMSGDSKKDLDNLLKILFDVLSDDMIQNNTDPDLKGLGFMKDDEMVFEVRSSKIIVKTKDEMGFSISIYETSKE